LRDAAYEMQMQSRRRELHALAVGALEHLYAEVKGRYAELAYHARYAGLNAKAQAYYLLAGKFAADSYQNHQAIEYYNRALAFTPLSDVPTQFDILIQRVEVFNRVGNRPAQLRDLESLEVLAAQLHDVQCLAHVDMLFAHYSIAIGDYPSVVKRSERVMKHRHLVKDADIVLDTYRVWPLALLRQGDLEGAMWVAREGRELAQIDGEPIKEGYILNSMGLIAIEQGDSAMAHVYLERALLISKEAKDRKLESICLNNLGNSAGYVRKDYAAAREYYQSAYRLHREIGNRALEAVALGNLGWVAGMQGDSRAAREYLEQALLGSREVGNVDLQTNSLVNLSSLMLVENDGKAALEYAQKAIELSLKTGDRSGEAWSSLCMGYAYLALSNFPEAERSFRQSVAIRTELKQPGMGIEAKAGLIQVLLLRGDGDAALHEAETILSYLNSGGGFEGVEEPLRVYYACYLALIQKQDSRSKAVLRSACQLLESQLAKLPDDKARQIYVENVPWRLAIWQASREPKN
jgi:tetratricopeptide (TPR) repeat protein